MSFSVTLRVLGTTTFPTILRSRITRTDPFNCSRQPCGPNCKRRILFSFRNSAAATAFAIVELFTAAVSCQQMVSRRFRRRKEQLHHVTRSYYSLEASPFGEQKAVQILNSCSDVRNKLVHKLIGPCVPYLSISPSSRAWFYDNFTWLFIKHKRLELFPL